MTILLLVALGTVLDNIITPSNTFIRSMIVSYYIANESLSILENIGACGVPFLKHCIKYRTVSKAMAAQINAIFNLCV